MSTYTDDQACVVAHYFGREEHRKTIPAWAAKDRETAAKQREFVRRDVRTEVGNGIAIHVAIVPGYCGTCRDERPACLDCGGKVPAGEEGRMSGMCQTCLNGARV